MAEKTFQKLIKNTSLEEIEVNSAGIAAMPHYTIWGELKEVMDENEIDYSGHIPQMVDKSIMKNSDIIFVMTRMHKREIVSRFPKYRDKVFLLSEYVNGIEEDIADPIGLGREAYRRSFEDINRYLEKLVEKLKNET
jgi:protein-tyrosine phosphatase